jgi:hypothetical protein
MEEVLVPQSFCDEQRATLEEAALDPDPQLGGDNACH